jgi:hypothetical protein
MEHHYTGTCKINIVIVACAGSLQSHKHLVVVVDEWASSKN